VHPVNSHRGGPGLPRWEFSGCTFFQCPSNGCHCSKWPWGGGPKVESTVTNETISFTLSVRGSSTMNTPIISTNMKRSCPSSTIVVHMKHFNCDHVISYLLQYGLWNLLSFRMLLYKVHSVNWFMLLSPMSNF
jgi:hypothetical protein